ncbi:MAG: alpha/beta fold hydrolase [Opitutaceae bacterium]|nr:alpha/beta fold hydrolase [Opitutaceae bacterium]
MSALLLQAAERRGLAVPPPPHGPESLGELAAALFLRPRRGLRRTPREQAYLEGARPLRLPSPAGPLAGWAWGDPGRPAVALVHGWEGHAAQLGAFAAPLVAAGFRPVAFDAPGHGESPGDEASVPQLGRVLAALEAAVGPWAAMIGHSMGAAAAAMATTCGCRPRGLVMLAPPQSQDEPARRLMERLRLDAEVRPHFLAALARRTGREPAETDLRVVARRAPCPLRVFHDPADPDTSYAAAEETVALWRGARLVPCPGRGHHRILATPAVVAQAVDFIRAPAP